MRMKTLRPALFPFLVLFAVMLVDRQAHADRPTLRIEDRASAFTRTMTTVFDNADLMARSLPGYGRCEHRVNLAAAKVSLTPRMTVHLGGGVAELGGTTSATAPSKHGYAIGGGLSLAIFETERFRVGVEVDVLQIAYAGGSLSDGTMRVAISSR